VEALPADLPDRIEIDLANLVNIGDAIHVRDLSLPAEVEVLTDPEEMIVLITAPAAAEEEEVEEAEVAGEEPEVIERGRKEEEEF
jgi:large subunit ribosomal protein L25